MAEHDDKEYLRKASAACDAVLCDKNNNLVFENTESLRSVATTQIKFDGATERGTTLTADEAKDRIASCREMYDNVGIIGNIIDIMVDFSMQDIVLVHPSRPIENFYKNWQAKVSLWSFLESSFKCLYRDANVPVIKFRGQISTEEIVKFRKTYAAKNKKGHFVDVNESKTFIIPYAYKILDVLKLYKLGNELLNVPRYSYMISAEDIALLNGPASETEKAAVENLKKALGPKDFDILVSQGLLNIDPSRITMLYYKKDDFKQWANPLLWRVVDDVKFKKLLRNMDISAAESVCSAMTIIKLGDRKNGFHPNKAMFDKFGSMLKNPSKSKTILWDDLVSIETAYPPIERVLGSEKYKQVNDDIRSGLGISEILVNGEGGNYSNSYLSVKTLLERLEGGRQAVLGWLNGELLSVAKAMGFREPAIAQMAHTSLQSEEVERRLILELYDRNIVSARTAAKYFGENLDIELKRMHEEAAIRKQIREFEPDMTLFKVGKFTPVNFVDLVSLDDGEQPGTPSETPDEYPTQQGDDGEKGGRPRGTKKKQDSPKKVTPKGVGTKASIRISDITIDERMYNLASKRFDILYNSFTSALIKKYGYNSISDFSDEENEKIFTAIDKVLCRLDKSKDYTKENIMKVLADELATAPAKLERCVKEVKDKKVKNFVKKNGRKPNKKEMQDITSSTWAICRSALNM